MLKKCCNRETGIFILRIVLGIIFLSHGASKFLDTAGGIGFFSQLGLNQYMFYAVATLETIGGIALLAGVFTRYAGLIMALFTLAFAIFAKIIPIIGEFKNIPAEVPIPLPILKVLILLANTEIDLVLIAGSLLLFLGGATKWALSSMCKCKCHHGEKRCGLCKAVGCADVGDSQCCSCSPHHTRS